MSTRIHVSSLSPDTTESQLQEFFAKHGTIVSVAIKADKNNRLNRFGLVCMEKAEEAQKAITVLSGKQLDGQKMSIHQVYHRLNTKY